MKLKLQNHLVTVSFALLFLLTFAGMNAQTPVPMLSQPSTTYTENFADIANWTNNFAAGTGANRWASYPITTGGTANDGKRTTKSSATFVTGTSGGVQKGTQSMVFLSTGSSTPSEAVAVDLLLDFTGTNAGTLSFNWAAVDNGNGTRPTSLRVFWSIDNVNFTEITQVLDIQSVNSGAVTNVALPAAFNNVSTARLRFYNHAGTITGSGNRDKISIDDITVTATPNASSSITASGTLASLSTTYGTPSSNTQFTAGGFNLNEGITITPPVGFEVAVSSDFSTTIGTNASPLLIGAAGTVADTVIYVRLAGNATAGNHTGNIVLSSAGATSVNVATHPTNTVNAKGLTITGITANDKPFDNTTTATLSGTPVLVGVVPGDEPNVILGGTPVANFNDATIGNDKPVTVTGYSISGSAASNYTLAQPTGLTASILPSGLEDQTIDFGPLAPVTYGDAPFNLTATASSGLVVTYTSSDESIASVSGNTVTIHAAGTVTITAHQAGDSNYNAADDVSQALLINPKALTITGADAQDKPYDGTTTATLTGTLDGVIAPDVVTLNLSGHFNDANVGTDKPVTSTSTLSGADASNYTLTQPTGLTASITLGTCGVSETGTIGWDFSTGASPSLSTLTNSVLPIDLTRGNNNGTTTPLISTTSPSSVYAGASGTQNAGAAVFTGALNTAASTYFEFTFSPEPGYNFTVNGMSFGSRSTGTGPQAYTLRSSLDNFTGNIATGSLTNNSSWALYTANVTAVTSNGAPITFRLYGHNGTGSPALNTANWRIDDLNLQLSVTPTSALSSAASATTCSGAAFSYTATTNYSGATISWTRAAVAGISNAAVTTPQTSNPSEILINTTSSPVDVVYAFTITTATCTLTQDVTVTVNNCSSVVNLKLFVEAYYLGAGTMRPVKSNQDGISAADEVEDIVVKLYDANVPHALLHSTVATLKTDGTAQAVFDTAPNGSFYIAVKSSNALQTWTAAPQAVGTTPLDYDFSVAADRAYGDNQAQVGPGVFAVYSGDINQDGNIDTIDYPIWELDSNNFESGVFETDLNGDGNVDTIDYPVWENNSNNFISEIAPF